MTSSPPHAPPGRKKLEQNVCGDWPGGFALTVIFRSPRPLAGDPLLEAGKAGRVVKEGPVHFLRKERRDCSIAMVMHSQYGHESSTKMPSVFCNPNHGGQRS